MISSLSVYCHLLGYQVWGHGVEVSWVNLSALSSLKSHSLESVNTTVLSSQSLGMRGFMGSWTSIYLASMMGLSGVWGYGWALLHSTGASKPEGSFRAKKTKWWQTINRKCFKPTPAEWHNLETWLRTVFRSRKVNDTGMDTLEKKW